jgi:Na+-translocating ferredoxin:NAD+ oxidoreductase RNF subunit RnfB
MSIILITLIVSVLLAFLIGVGLGFFQQKFKVERDPKIDQIREALPGANCGACGFPGCDSYAEAVAGGETPPNKCSVGGSRVAIILAEILGVSVSAEDTMAVVRCQGTHDKAPKKGHYVGIPSCGAAKLSAGGTKLCAWGCYGYGDCEANCPFDAIKVGEDGIPHVDDKKCTGCGKCVSVCPQRIIALYPRKDRQRVLPLCSNRNSIKAMVRRTCAAGCFKCELCVKNCPAKAIRFENLLPVVDYSLCTSCNICVTKCPTKAFSLIRKQTA